MFCLLHIVKNYMRRQKLETTTKAFKEAWRWEQKKKGAKSFSIIFLNTVSNYNSFSWVSCVSIQRGHIVYGIIIWQVRKWFEKETVRNNSTAYALCWMPWRSQPNSSGRFVGGAIFSDMNGLIRISPRLVNERENCCACLESETVCGGNKKSVLTCGEWSSVELLLVCKQVLPCYSNC